MAFRHGTKKARQLSGNSQRNYVSQWSHRRKGHLVL